MKRHILGALILVVILTTVVNVGAVMLINLQPSKVITSVLATALTIVVYPFFAITETLLYYDVRIRKEGFDVEYLASAVTAHRRLPDPSPSREGGHMILLPPQAAARTVDAKQIHDTVAAIARQPAYATPVRQSLLGRVLRTLFAGFAICSSNSRLARRAVRRHRGGRADHRRDCRSDRDRTQIDARRRAGAGLRAIGGERRDYWALAAELAAAGNYTGACHALYIGVLDALSRTGALRFHASKTSGDYARELRRGIAAVANDFPRSRGSSIDRLRMERADARRVRSFGARR